MEGAVTARRTSLKFCAICKSTNATMSFRGKYICSNCTEVIKKIYINE